jgi:predicted GNAT family acetyltransferase
MYGHAQLINNQSNHSFELLINGERSFIDYRQQGDIYQLIHTEVPKDLQGQGIAALLVEKTFQYLEANHFKMIPYCAYIQAYLKKHPDWHRLIAK